MEEFFNGDEIPMGAADQGFKVKIGTGTASIQLQAQDEGFDEIEDMGFTATGTGLLGFAGGTVKIVLTGDARFFMATARGRL